MSVRWEAVKAARPPAWPCSSAPPPDPSVHADADAAGPAASSDFLLPGVRGPHCCRLPRPATCRPPRRTRTWERAARSLLSCVASARGRVFVCVGALLRCAALCSLRGAGAGGLLCWGDWDSGREGGRSQSMLPVRRQRSTTGRLRPSPPPRRPGRLHVRHVYVPGSYSNRNHLFPSISDDTVEKVAAFLHPPG